MPQDILVIYHSDCSDGFGAAFAAWLKFGDRARYLPAQYNDGNVPDVAGKHVYIVDFSFEPEVLARMEAQAASLTLLDHHQSAANKFCGYQCRCGNKVLFDLNRSGARLAWEHFHPDTDVPELIACIEDRDLWRWKRPETARYLAALDALGFDFDAWKSVMLMSEQSRQHFLHRGEAMNDKFNALCEGIAAPALPVVIDGVPGLMTNTSAVFANVVGELLHKRSGTFGAVWQLTTHDTVKVSLRSQAPFDVSAIALRFGGGGHPQAASFNLPVARLADIARGVLESNP
jgi:oligoribonuclease NrnB/cAMP/cGMP phosphodiesterase (DHH superfamily)